ncbi:hypothetical protein BDZ85DRAFT_58378 [Elsinoe ampelina]|uniref:Uncharacterized protein n=1 Tax=Elsinoe ampelina TaxID=302913 RepID=A0A6A6GN86_9PEZI|nr:hypothetical protein BDZ85DRAFT_58378 [Elsinoe ampelina]
MVWGPMVHTTSTGARARQSDRIHAYARSAALYEILAITHQTSNHSPTLHYHEAFCEDDPTCSARLVFLLQYSWYSPSSRNALALSDHPQQGNALCLVHSDMWERIPRTQTDTNEVLHYYLAAFRVRRRTRMAFLVPSHTPPVQGFSSHGAGGS